MLSQYIYIYRERERERKSGSLGPCHNLGLKKLSKITVKIISEIGFPQD